MRNIYVCYFLSGAAGLVYQILWLRKLLLVFGSTVHAVSTVLTVFFGGLALGSWLFGRLIDRREGAGLRWYALLEVGVGLYAFLTLPLFDMIQHVYLPVYRASGFAPAALVGASFACSAAILLLPTMLLGGTFPALSRFLIRASEERGVKIAGLYGLNTAGAMVGTLLVYYVGLPMLGLARTLMCVGVLNIGIGLLCLVFDRHLETLEFRASPAASAPAAQPEDLSRGMVRWLFVAFGLSGFSAITYEVAWTRALSLVLGSSIYAFCIMLATFLGGMAAGSGFARGVLRERSASLAWFIRLELLLGLYGLLSVALFSELPDWFVTLWPVVGQSFFALSLLHVLLSGAIMIVPTVIMGFLFPIVSDLVTRRFAQLGQRLGSAYAINTLGGIVGSFLSGFVLIPLLGLPWAIAVAALVNVVAGCLIYLRFGEGGSAGRRLAVAAALLVSTVILSATVVVPSWQRKVLAAGVYLTAGAFQRSSVAQGVAGAKLLYYRDSLNATVSVHQQGETIFLKVGGKTDASTGVDMGTQVLSAHIPLLLHPDPKGVLVIGLGSGVTLGHAGRHPVSTLHCAEIDPAVIEGARYFKAHNYDVHNDPRTRIFAADGRNLLLASQQRYDVIISEPSNPWMAGLAYLFTQEFYQLAKRRLASGGIVCQWVQLYRIFPADVKLLLKTFHEEFPHVSVWSSIPGDLLLVGSMEPHQFDGQRLAERMAEPAIRESLRLVEIERPEQLLQLFWMGNREVEEVTADVDWLHQDDQPWLEFSAPKALYAASGFFDNFAGLEQFKADPGLIAPGYRMPADGAFHRALASLWDFRGERVKAKNALEEAVALEPASSDAWVRVGEFYLKERYALDASEALKKAIQLDASNAKACRLLGKLHWQQRQLAQAQHWYERAASLQPPDGVLAEEIGDCLREGGQLPWSAEYYRSSVSQGGGGRPALMAAYAQVLRELKQWRPAEQVLRFGVKAFPKEAVFPLLLGETFLDQEQWSEAVPWLRQALALAPRQAKAYYGLGRVAASQNKREEAVRLLREGLRYNPYDRDALRLLRQLRGGSA